MASGGARNRSGPPMDPNSGRSERRGVKLTALPNEGYQGEVPEFPVPGASNRELAVWESLWRRPQACAWISQPWRWDAIAELAMLQVRAEARDCPVNVYERIRQWRADLGLTPAGLLENGWAIATADIVPQGEPSEGAKPRQSSRDRLKVAK